MEISLLTDQVDLEVAVVPKEEQYITTLRLQV